MMEVLDLVRQAAVICDGCGQILHINRLAAALLGSGYGATARAIDFEDFAGERNFRRVLQAVLAPEGPSDVQVPLRVRGCETLAFRALPLVRQAPPIEADGVALLLIERQRASLEEILAARFGLTAAEVRVVSRMAHGASIGEIADRNGVRPATVRSQLKSIFLKTGMRRQSQLVALAASLRSDVGAGG